MLAETRKQNLGDAKEWTIPIEEVWPGDVVKGIGRVSSIIDRAGEKFIRLVLEDGRVMQGYYGKKIIIDKLSDLFSYSR